MPVLRPRRMDTPRRTTTTATAIAAAALLTAVYALGQSGSHPSAGLAPVATYAVASPAATGAMQPTITVSGLGKISGAPDMLALALGVHVRAADVGLAMTGASKSMRTVIAALRQAGVADADLQTAGVSVQPNYIYANKSGPKLAGYIADQQLNAKIRNVSKAGAIIGAAIAAGGNTVRLNGVSLSLDNDSALLSKARDRAFMEAKSKAQQYAALAGVTLGQVVSIDDSVVAGNQPFYGRAALSFAADASAAAAPIQVGTQDVAVTVSVVYGIG